MAEEKSVEELIQIVRKQCEDLKVGGSIMGLSTVFRNFDTDKSNKLNYEEFSKGMTTFGINLTQDEMKRLFSKFDKDSSRVVDFNEFLKVLAPPLKECRKRIVLHVFNMLDKNSDGVLTTDDIAQNEYFVNTAKRHPKYKQGQWKTLEEVYANFIKTFDDTEKPDGVVTKEEFLDYYTKVSCAVDRDDAFDLMMCKAYNLDRNKVKTEDD